MSNVSLERYYFVLYNGTLTLKMPKMALNTFCDKTLQMELWYLSRLLKRMKCSNSTKMLQRSNILSKYRHRKAHVGIPV